MDLVEVKNKITKLYYDYLEVDSNIDTHPIRIIQASKSLIGIKTDKPLFVLSDYLEGYLCTQKYKIRESYTFESTNPSMVSYKQLEESLLAKNLSLSYKNIYNLTQVSEGKQILEFLIEFALKYGSKSYMIVWSVYKMNQFLNNKYIKMSVDLCVYNILSEEYKISNRKDKINIKNDLFSLCKTSNNSFELLSTAYNIFYENLTRSKKVNEHICNMTPKFLEKNVSLKQCNNYTKNQIKMGRLWLHEFISHLDPDKLDCKLILKLDAARGILKITEDKNYDSIPIWNCINENIRELNEYR